MFSETSLALPEKHSAVTGTEVQYIPAGNHRGQNSTERVSSYFPSNLAGPCQTALQTMSYLTCWCKMCWRLLFSIPTVIQGVDIALLGLNNQSFARLMEQRLAPLFMMSHQQGRRFKRATTVGSYTVQVVDATSVAPRRLFGCIRPEFVRKTQSGLRFPVFFFINTKAVNAICMALLMNSFFWSQTCFHASHLLKAVVS